MIHLRSTCDPLDDHLKNGLSPAMIHLIHLNSLTPRVGRFSSGGGGVGIVIEEEIGDPCGSLDQVDRVPQLTREPVWTDPPSLHKAPLHISRVGCAP